MDTREQTHAKEAASNGLPDLSGAAAAAADPLTVTKVEAAEARLEQERARGLPAITKRALDLVVSVIALTLLAPLLALIAIVIKLDSPGPVIYRQARVGRGGVFEMLKFRTMSDGADELRETLHHLNENDGILFKSRRDPRITRVGRLLRPAFLDELPQLFQVATGRMSLVGPRAMPPTMNAQIDQAYRERRLVVRPGITGEWQVDRTERRRSIQDMARMDVEYIRDWSLVGDLKILLKTVPYVATRHGV